MFLLRFLSCSLCDCVYIYIYRGLTLLVAQWLLVTRIHLATMVSSYNIMTLYTDANLFESEI